MIIFIHLFIQRYRRQQLKIFFLQEEKIIRLSIKCLVQIQKFRIEVNN